MDISVLDFVLINVISYVAGLATGLIICCKHKDKLLVKSMDIVSLGVHARRTWFLYKKVFTSASVGIIAIESKNYDPLKWWLYSAGVRGVISEMIAYLYVRLIFNPPS